MNDNKCIFCKESGDIFHTIEHIVPESLGNTEDILYDGVCDKCQNYFGREIENYILRKSPFGFWRTLSKTVTKKGNLPYYDTTQKENKTSKISDYHKYTDEVKIYPVDSETIIAAEFSNFFDYQSVLKGEKQKINIVFTPKMLIYMGRFLGKVALEYWYKEFGSNIFHNRFDAIRKYVRYGTTKDMWPILNGKLDENLLEYKTKNEAEEERTLYSYKFYEINAQIIFCFDIGMERYSMILTERFPNADVFTEEVMVALCYGTIGVPNILFYNL